MDTLEKLGSQLSQVTMYDVKSMYNQAKNIVLNVSEMEAKVRDATNDDPWGASSTLMTDIAQGTFNYQQFNEIMPCIYSRFMEKEARQWRQIYKALQLLEYLIKHGSERVVDDARSHLGTIKMLRSFHYVDEKGKDQGINIRNRSREIVELLGDLDRVRTERKKAKQNRSKYTGVGNDEMSFSAGGSRYGGFSSDQYHGGGGGGGGSSSGGWDGGVSSTSDHYRNNGGGSSRSGGGGSSGGFRDTSSRQDFDEYDAGDDDDRKPTSSASRAHAPPQRRSTAPPPAAAPRPPKVQEEDLLGGFDDPVPAPAPATNKALPAPVGIDDDDDFGDFTGAGSAPAPAPVPVAALPKPAAGGGMNVFDVLGATPTAPPVRAATISPTSGMSSAQSGGFGGFAAAPAAPRYTGFGGNIMAPATPTTPTARPASAAKPTPSAAPKAAGSGFDDLWSMSLGSAAAPKPASSTTGKSMMDLQKEKTEASIWGGGAKPAQQNQWGSFGGTSGGAASSGGGDDLLL